MSIAAPDRCPRTSPLVIAVGTTSPRVARSVACHACALGRRPSPASGDLVAERDPRRPSGRLLRQGDMDASYVDLADPSHLEFDYMRWIRIVLRAARARRVVHVGGGACALARALAAEDPGRAPGGVRGRRRTCSRSRASTWGSGAPRGLRVRLADGRAFLAGQAGASWDAVVVDAFVAATVPRRLITVEALADVARVAPLALVNVLDNRAARDVRTIGGGAGAAYPRVWALGGGAPATRSSSARRRALDLAGSRQRPPPTRRPPGSRGRTRWRSLIGRDGSDARGRVEARRDVRGVRHPRARDRAGHDPRPSGRQRPAAAAPARLSARPT